MAEWWEGEKPGPLSTDTGWDYPKRIRQGNALRRSAGLDPWPKGHQEHAAAMNGESRPDAPLRPDTQPESAPAPDVAPDDTDWGDLVGQEGGGSGKPPAAARTMVRGVSGQAVLMLRTLLQAFSWMVPNHLQHLRPLILLDPLEEQMIGNLIQSYIMGLPAKARAKAVFAFNRVVPPVGLIVVGAQIILRRWQILRLVIASQPSGRPIVTPPPAGPARPMPAPSQVVSDPETTTEQAAPASDLMEAIG